jgi:AraC-like DNA-binding protein
MIKPGPDERIFPTAKLATAVDAFVTEGVPLADALNGVDLSESDISSPKTRVSLNQIIECYRNANKISHDPRFAYQAGLRFHVSTYGMYGFAILSSVSFRQTVRFAVSYHTLATPTTEISFKEHNGSGIWTIAPVSHPRVDATLYRFLVELQFGSHVSLHRDVMGPSFAPQEIHVTYTPPADAEKYPAIFGCNVLFGQSENRLLFDAAWLDAAPQLGNKTTYSSLARLCDELLQELQLHVGLGGKVREILLVNLAQPTSFDAVAKHLNMTPRTLRRRLREENTSYRELIDELRMHVAIKYLRDTELTIEDIADSLGFSEAANFRHAFHRWTGRTPQEFRRTLDTLHKA